MKLTSLLSEGKARITYGGSKVEFYTSFKNGQVNLIAKSSKDLDTIQDILSKSSNPRLADEEFRNVTALYLKKKTGLEFESDPYGQQAGYTFNIKDDKFLKMLERVESDMNLSNIVEDILNEGPAENKKVKALLDKHLKDLRKGGANHQWAVMHILMGALSDANFHSEAKGVAKLFPKAKYEGDPMAEKDLEEMYHYDLGPDVANICKWDGKDIVNAMGFYISMTIGRPLGQKVEALVENAGMRLFKESVYLKEGRKSKDSAGVRYVEAIYNNSESITKMVLSDKKDVKEVVDVMGPVLINAIKAALSHNYKPNAQPAYTLKRDLDRKGNLSNQERIDVFKKGLKELLTVATELVKRPSKVGVKKLDNKFTEFWNHEYGANIGLNGTGPHDNTIIESLNEAEYPVYHKSFTSAADAAKKYAEKRGFEVDEDDWSTQIGMGGKNVRSRPSEGKTTEFTVGLLKGGKPQRKSLQIQVYGMKNGYELNAYIN